MELRRCQTATCSENRSHVNNGARNGTIVAGLTLVTQQSIGQKGRQRSMVSGNRSRQTLSLG